MPVYGGTLAPPGRMTARLSAVRNISTTSMTAVELTAPARQKTGSAVYISPPLDRAVASATRTHARAAVIIIFPDRTDQFAGIDGRIPLRSMRPQVFCRR